MSTQAETQIVTLLESDLPKLLISGPVSSRTTFQVRVDGPFGEREGRNLVRLIQAHIAALFDDDAKPDAELQENHHGR